MTVFGQHLNRCPPREAMPQEVTYFRLVKDGRLGKNGFLSYAELFPNNSSYSKCCKAHALSLVPNEEAAKRLVKKFPKAFSTHGMAKIHIKPEHGKLFRDKPDHISWWREQEYTPEIISQNAELILKKIKEELCQPIP